MKKNTKRFFYNKCGAAAVEFALVAPLLFTLMFGLIELGRVYYIRSNMQYSADEAGRFVMLNTSATDDSITSKVSSNITAIPSANVTTTVQTQTISSKTYKTISLSYSFTSVVGSIVNLGTIPISVQSSVPVLP